MGTEKGKDKWHLTVNGRSYHSDREVREQMEEALEKGRVKELPSCEYSRHSRALAGALAVQMIVGPTVEVEVREGRCDG
jgi:hypothetical protein